MKTVGRYEFHMVDGTLIYGDLCDMKEDNMNEYFFLMDVFVVNKTQQKYEKVAITKSNIIFFSQTDFKNV